MIKVSNLSKAYNHVEALSGISFELEEHSLLVIQGPSGSGKTTLLRLIAGLEFPDAGEIFIGNRLCSRPGWILEPYRRNLGFVFQQSTLWPHMTVAQNIDFTIQGQPKATREKIRSELLTHLGLSGMENRFPNELSGGEARRVELARALAPNPRTILMDEPLIYLEPALKTDLLALILETVNANKISLLYVTHDYHEAEQISQNRLELLSGKIMKQ